MEGEDLLHNSKGDSNLHFVPQLDDAIKQLDELGM